MTKWAILKFYMGTEEILPKFYWIRIWHPIRAHQNSAELSRFSQFATLYPSSRSRCVLSCYDTRRRAMAFYEARDFLFCGICGTTLFFSSSDFASCPLCGFKRSASGLSPSLPASFAYFGWVYLLLFPQYSLLL
jgi:hypothetical protein